MKDLGTFEVVAREKPDSDGVFQIKAGRGCVWLSIGWLAVFLLLAVGLLARACS